MNINNINGLGKIKDLYGFRKKAGKSERTPVEDKVTISDEARIKQTEETLLEVGIRHLKDSPAIRDEKVASAIEKIRQGYIVDDGKSTVIAEQIQELLNAFEKNRFDYS